MAEHGPVAPRTRVRFPPSAFSKFWRVMLKWKLILFIIPKNTGLKECKNIVKEYVNSKIKFIEVRGEDVPLVVSRLVKKGEEAIGITGEDLLKEFLLKNYNTEIKILKRIPWKNKKYLFEKPTLCLLGPKNKKLEDLGKNLKICINSKYKELAKKYYLNYLENKGYRFEKIYASGATEEFFYRGIVDLVIDIVCSGKSAKKVGLEVYDKIFESDIVIIGEENEKI